VKPNINSDEVHTQMSNNRHAKMVCAGSLWNRGNGSGVKTNRVTPIIYLGITFTPSYYKQSNSLLHKNSLALGAKLTWDHGLLFIHLFIYLFIKNSATNISRVAK
jgi:hypothetical protein